MKTAAYLTKDLIRIEGDRIRRRAATMEVQDNDPGLMTWAQFLKWQNPEGTQHPSEAYNWTLEEMNKDWAARNIGQDAMHRGFELTKHAHGYVIHQGKELVAVSDGTTCWVKHPLKAVPTRYIEHGSWHPLGVALGTMQQVKYPVEHLGRVYNAKANAVARYPLVVQNLENGYQLRAESNKPGASMGLIHDGMIVGVAQSEWGATLISVAQEYRGHNLGAILRRYWGERNPDYTSGGYTSAGKGMAKRVWSDRVRQLMEHGVYSNLLAQGKLTREQILAILKDASPRSSKTPSAPTTETKGSGKLLVYVEDGMFVLYDAAFLQDQDDEHIKGHGFMRNSPHVGTFYYTLDYAPGFQRPVTAIALQLAKNEGDKLYVGQGYADLLDPMDFPVEREGDYIFLKDDVLNLAPYIAQEKRARKAADPYGEIYQTLLERANYKTWQNAPVGLQRSAKQAKGVLLPDNAEELWLQILRATMHPDTAYDGNAALWTSQGEFWITMPPTGDLTRLTFSWMSQERGGHKDTQAKGWARRTGSTGAIFIFLPEKLMQKAWEGTATYQDFEPYHHTFIHELTHVLDPSVGFDTPKGLTYPTDAEWLDDHAKAYGQWAQHPKEWRAVLTEIRHELQGVEHAPGMNVVELLDSESPTWGRIAPHLSSQGRRYLLKALGQDLLGPRPPKVWSYGVPDLPSMERIQQIQREAQTTLGPKSPEARFMDYLLQMADALEAQGWKEYPKTGYDRDTIMDILQTDLRDAWRHEDTQVQQWVSSRMKVAKTAGFSNRAWIAPDGEVHPISGTYEGDLDDIDYEPSRYRHHEGVATAMGLINAGFAIRVRGWARVGTYTQWDRYGSYIEAANLNDRQLHAFQKMLMENPPPEGRTPGSHANVVFEGGLNGSIPYDEFLTLNSVNDVRRALLGSRMAATVPIPDVTPTAERIWAKVLAWLEKVPERDQDELLGFLASTVQPNAMKGVPLTTYVTDVLEFPTAGPSGFTGELPVWVVVSDKSYYGRHVFNGAMLGSTKDMKPIAIVVNLTGARSVRGLIEVMKSRVTSTTGIQEFSRLVSMLKHEATHAAQRPAPAMDPNSSRLDYYNAPGEFEAYLQQILHEISDSSVAVDPEFIQEWYGGKGNTALLENILADSPTWQQTQKFLTVAHRREVFREVSKHLHSLGVFSKAAKVAAAAGDVAFYVAAEGGPTPTLVGTMTLHDDPHVAQAQGSGQLYRLHLQPDAELVALWDLDHPAVRSIKDDADVERMLAHGQGVSDQEWVQHTFDHTELETVPWIVRRLRDAGVAGVWVRSQHAGNTRLALVVIDTNALCSQELATTNPHGSTVG